jgi:predicted AAA+ superfamily ATPase
LYKTNILPILEDTPSINLGSVYESVVAQELKAHGHNLFYYDNKHHGEVDFLIADYDNLSVLPIEVKSGKDYKIHVALTHFTQTPDYHINKGIVLSNGQKWETKGMIIYIPVYFVMFL